MFESPTTSHGRALYVRFVLWFAAFPLLVYLAAFPFVRSAFYGRITPSQWSPRLDYAFDTEHQNADVLIYGDSSAFIGVDPRLVHAQLGLKTIVLPATVASLSITGELALKHYLATNSAPRLLVVYLSAWDLDYAHVPNPHPFEGEEMLFRHAGWADIASFAAHHPIETLAFPFRLYSTYYPSAIRGALKRSDRESTIGNALGHFDDTEPFPALTDGCQVTASYLTLTSTRTVQDLVRKYSAKMPVMVYLSPLPGCANAAPFFTRSYAALNAAPPVVLPPRDFLGDLGYAHVEPAFVAVSTGKFIEVLSKRLGVSQIPMSSQVADKISH